MRVGAHAPELDLQKGREVLIGDGVGVSKVAGVDLPQLLYEHQQLLVSEGVQADDGCQHVAHVLAGKAPLRQAAAQSLVAKDAAAAVLDGGRRAAHDDAQMVRLALQGVVVHRENLLVVVLARDGVGDLVEVHQLIDKHEHALVAAQHQETRKQLDVVVPVVIADDRRASQVGAGLALGAVLAAQPTGHAAHGLLVALDGGRTVAHEHTGKVKAVDHFLQAGQLLAQLLVAVRVRVRLLAARYPAVQDEIERAALGARLGGEVADELAVGCKALALAALQAALGGEIRVCHHKALAHGMRADGLQKEALARAVASDQKPKARSAVGDQVEVGEQRADLDLAAHGDVGQADARHHAALEGVQDHGGDALGHAGRGGGIRIRHVGEFLPRLHGSLL